MLLTSVFKINNMSFKIGSQIKHENGYIWTVAAIAGAKISIKSESDGHSISETVSKKDLNLLIQMGYYTPLS